MSLNFNDADQQPKKRKNLAALLTVGALVGTIALGSTLAASINLNDSKPVEFGQGIAQTTACDDSILITPESTFINSEGEGDYVFSSITVSTISESCDGKDFIIKAYQNGTNTALPLYRTNGTDTYREIRVNYGLESSNFVEGGLLGENLSDIPNGFKITFATSGPPSSIALTSAQDVNRITIESTDATVSGSLSFANSSIVYDANDAFKFGTNDFTIESWAYVSSSVSSTDGATFYDTGSEVNYPGGFAFWIEGDQLKYRINGCYCGFGGFDISVPMIWYNDWHHYAVARTNGRVKLFVDGTLVASSYDSSDQSPTNVNTLNLTRNTPSIGRLDGYGNRFALAGKMESLRVINGFAKYEADFTPPNQLTKEAGTVLLLKPTSSANKFFDRSDYGWVPSTNSVLPAWSTEHR